MIGPRRPGLAGLRAGPWPWAPLLLCLALALCGASPAPAREAAPQGAPALPGTRAVSVQEAQRLLAHPPAGLVILDVRTPGEFREGHLPGAQNLDFFGGAFETRAEALPRDAPLLLYCRSGRRSQAAAEALEKSGHGGILHMDAGIEGWKKAGLALEK